MNLFAELRRRNVIRVALFYFVASWLIIQVAETVLPLFDVPEAMLRGLVILLAIGFVPALVFSWIYELTPEGLKRESEIAAGESITRSTGRKLDIVTLVALAGVVAFVLIDRERSGEAVSETPTVPAMEGAPPSPTAAEPPSTQAPDLSIAVLPFASMSADPENAYFADGLTEELLNLLAQIETLKVAGRTSSFYFKGRNEDLKSIGAQLNVAHVLEGSVRRSGDRLRITAQLIKVEDGYHLWSQTYDRVLDDVFAIQEDIAQSIGQALRIELALVPEARDGQTDDVEAYTLYMHGRQLWNTRAIENLEQAIEMFRKAVERDPDYALAWSGLADAIDALAWRKTEGLDLLPEGLAAARRAIELAPDQAAGYASLGILLAETQRQWEEGGRYLKRALELNPNYGPALHWYADVLRVLGQDEEGLSVCHRAMAADPLSVSGKSACAGLLWQSGQDDARAIEMWQQALTVSPDIVNVNLGLARSGQISGELSATEAGGYLVHWARLRGFDDPERIRLIIDAHDDPNLREQAIGLIEAIDRTTEADPLELFYLLIHVDARDRALDQLEAAEREGIPALMYVGSELHIPAEVREHPRFQAVVRALNLPLIQTPENKGG